MSEFDEIMNIIFLFGSEDETEREKAKAEIRSLGKEAIPYLNRARGNIFRYPYVEVFQMLADIGDDMFSAGGTEAISKSIISTMEHGAKIKKDTNFSPILVKNIGIQALTRWGLPVPAAHIDPIRLCHVCHRSSEETRIKSCFLLDCNNAVCQEHAYIMESRISTVWFCSGEHYQYANHQPEVMQ